ncbi:MAG: hypothetical protein GKS06_05915 [Acidobacteria bacterium]|nr:hypothetical protein [Acidobacteriota bacterium]
MRKPTRVVLSCLIFALAWGLHPGDSTAFEQIDALFVLDASSYEDTLRAEEAIELAGGRVELIFPNRVIIGQIDRASVAELRRDDTIQGVEFGEVAPRAGLARPNSEERTAIDFWNELVTAPPVQRTEHLEHFMMEGAARPAPPMHPSLRARLNAEQVLTPKMSGKIALMVFFVESDGKIDPETENWGNDWKMIKKQVVTGLKFWTSNAPKSEGLKFVLKFTKPKKAKVSYEPINRSSSEEGLWISELMTKKGFPDSRVGSGATYFDQVFAHNAKLAKKFKTTGGAVSEFVVASKNDADHKFTDGAFGYAYLGGWFTVMTYGNNGWGPERFNLVQAHENGHLTGEALDEYASSGCSCGETNPKGVKNKNCAACSAASCVMKDNSAPICKWTRKQLGWKK